MRRIILAVSFALLPLAANATAYWTPSLSNWTVHLNNGYVYVTASNMPSHCSYSRAQIETSSTTYQRDLYAYVMATYAAGKPLRLVVNDQETACKVYGAIDTPA